MEELFTAIDAWVWQERLELVDASTRQSSRTLAELVCRIDAARSCVRGWHDSDHETGRCCDKIHFQVLV